VRGTWYETACGRLMLFHNIAEERYISSSLRDANPMLPQVSISAVPGLLNDPNTNMSRRPLSTFKGAWAPRIFSTSPLSTLKLLCKVEVVNALVC
jgi:hypothetical protein